MHLSVYAPQKVVNIIFYKPLGKFQQIYSLDVIGRQVWTH